ncbi:MAG: tetratricopeptide repeat protein, partial [Alphaproteobacteria bacterium]|nr:tetratricopeptide repeat protein [Alphaproteobacteria bacterium]
ALQLNPLDPQYYLIATQLALAHLGAGQFEKAAEYAHDAIRQQPDFLETRIALASALGHLERTEEARTAIEGLGDAAGDFVERHVLYARELKDCILDGLRKAGLPE